MKNNQFNKDFTFYREPVNFNKFTEKALLQYCLGGTLYMPGTKVILDKILNKNLNALSSMVMCFEDAIQITDVERAENNVLEHLNSLSDALENQSLSFDDIPLIFLRVRNLEQYVRFSERLTERSIKALSGFVFPKFYSSNANDYLGVLRDINTKFDAQLYAMPILEGRTIAYKETRGQELFMLKQIIYPFRDLILNIRIGGTDFSSIFGVRRGMHSSIYDILTVRDCIADILNFFNRENEDYTVSGPVWEYFLAYKEEDLAHLLEKDIHHSIVSRNDIINPAIDGLLREIVLDKTNGFVGKTIIHPSHLKFVNAMQAVTKEEYEDAAQIISTPGGVVKSANSNKMNEINPHRSWANQILKCADAYGVVENERSYLKLILGGS